MAKRKRKVGLKVYEVPIKVRVGEYFAEFGVPEVDRLMYCLHFRKFPHVSFTTISFPQVDRIKEGHKFRKFSPHSCTQNDKSTKVDRISRMPDDILQFIISFLTIKEGVATSILSTRWRHLWVTSFSRLNFDIPNTVGHDYLRTMVNNKDGVFLVKRNFTRWVNQVLELRRASRLNALRISFVLNKKFASHIDRWIKNATAHGVTDIQLDFSFNNFYFTRSEVDWYEFPVQQVTSSLKYLHLNKCIFRLPSDFTGFTSLITLSLVDLYVTQPIVDNILSKCPLLEFLSLAICRCEYGTRLKFGGQSLLLKHLHIGSAWCEMEIELHDVILSSFEAEGHVVILSIKNAPHLARLVLCDMMMPIEVWSNVPRIEMLFLTQDLEKSSIQSSVLSNIKRLVFIANIVTTNLLGVVYLLEACHLLQELELDMGVSEKRNTKLVGETQKALETQKTLATISGSPYKKLKEIEIYGFEAHPDRIELAKHLLKYAVVLEKMKIYTTSRVYCGNGRWRLFEATAKQAIPLEEVCKMLQKVVGSSTKLDLFTSRNHP